MHVHTSILIHTCLCVKQLKKGSGLAHSECRIKCPRNPPPPPRNKSPPRSFCRVESYLPGINPPGLNPPPQSFVTLILKLCSYLTQKCTKHWSVYFKQFIFTLSSGVGQNRSMIKSRSKHQA